MDHEQLSSLLQEVLSIARECRELVISSMAHLDVAQKSEPWDVVTNADMTAQTFLCERLTAALPGASFVGEESVETSAPGRIWWLVDPVDGTSNLVHGLSPAAVSVALVVDDVPALGVVVEIFSGDVYEAFRRGGARFIPGGEGSSSSQPIKIAKRASLHECLVGIGFPYRHANDPLMFGVAQALHAEVQDLRRSGSATMTSAELLTA